jgi:AAA family ATP:ADP antiporter
MIAALAQLGAIFGSAPTMGVAQFGGIWVLFLGATIAVGSTIFVMHYFMKTIPADELIGNKKAHATEAKKEGFFEGFTSGLILLFTKPYLIGVLIVSTFYEIITQIIEYQMQSNACVYPTYCTEEGFAYFQGIYGVCVNILAFSMALLGTSYLIKKYGLRFCLLFYPVCLATAFISLFIFFKLGSPSAGELLWATFGVLIIAKGLGYAVNNPVKEIMYIPTSKDVKFKSKGWIDMFGSRTAKQTGAQVTNAFKHSIPDLMVYGTMASLGLTAVWMLAAVYVGNKNRQLLKENQIIQ